MSTINKGRLLLSNESQIGSKYRRDKLRNELLTHPVRSPKLFYPSKKPRKIKIAKQSTDKIVRVPQCIHMYVKIQTRVLQQNIITATIFACSDIHRKYTNTYAGLSLSPPSLFSPLWYTIWMSLPPLLPPVPSVSDPRSHLPYPALDLPSPFSSRRGADRFPSALRRLRPRYPSLVVLQLSSRAPLA